MKFKKQYLTLTELGRVFGVVEREIGKRLINIGLRTLKRKPTFTAFHEGLATSSPNYSRSQDLDDRYVWHSTRVVAALIENGSVPAIPPPANLLTTPILDGPFIVRSNTDALHEIVGESGSVAVWVAGDRNAQIVCQLLNVGHRLGVIKCPQPEQQPETLPAEESVSTEKSGFVIYGLS